MSRQLKAKFKTARMNMAKFSEIACNILDREIILLLISLTLLSQAKKIHSESIYREPIRAREKVGYRYTSEFYVLFLTYIYCSTSG